MNFRTLFTLLAFCATISIQANSKLDSLGAMLDTVQNLDLRYSVMEEYTKIKRSENRKEAKPFLLQLLKIAEQLKDPEKIAITHREIASNYLLLNNNDSAFLFLDKATPYFESVKDTNMLAKIWNNYALLYQRTNEYEKATDTYHRVIEFSHKHDEYYGELAALVNVASVNINQGDHLKGIEYLLRADERYKFLKSKVNIDSSKDYDKEDGKEENTLEYQFHRVEEYLLPGIYINLGVSYGALDHRDSLVMKMGKDSIELKDFALDYLQESLEAIDNMQNSGNARYFRAYTLNNMGHIFYEKKQYQEAYETMKQSLGLAIAADNPQAIVSVKTELGKVLVKLKRHEDAEEILHEAIEQAQKHDIIEEIRDAYEHLADNAMESKDFENSVNYYRTHITYKDSLLNDERIAKLQESETKHKTQLKEQQIVLEKQKAERQRIIFMVGLIGVLGLGFLLYTRYKLRQERKAAAYEREVSTAMSRFVPTEFIQSIGRNHITEVQLGDQIEKELTVVFTDIRNFTSRSEKMTATDTFNFVRNYAEAMGPIIQKNGGFINQYLGDGVMAIFQNSPEDALIACVEMHDRLRSYNKELVEQGIEAIEVGMGLHTGPAVMGIIGDEKRRDAAMISDTINTAARMESKTKQYGVKILISEESRIRLKNPELYHLRHIGDVTVKGKEKPIDIYECFNAEDDVNFQKKTNSLKAFDEAVASYFAHDYKSAYNQFSKIKESNPDDKVAVSFISSIETKLEVDEEEIMIDELLKDSSI